MNRLSRNTLTVFLFLSALVLLSSTVGSGEKAANYSGTWEGNWTSKANAEAEGTFTARIIHEGSRLSGTLDVPDILEKTNMPLKGSVVGDRITFGDVDGVIVFKGKISSQSEWSGQYEYPLLGDYGTWQARK